MDTTYPELAELLLVVIKILLSKPHHLEADKGEAVVMHCFPVFNCFLVVVIVDVGIVAFVFVIRAYIA